MKPLSQSPLEREGAAQLPPGHRGVRWGGGGELRLGSSLSSHVTLDESLGIFEPQFLHLQSEPLLPLMQASWEDKCGTKYLRQLRYFINMGKRVRL